MKFTLKIMISLETFYTGTLTLCALIRCYTSIRVITMVNKKKRMKFI